MKFNSYVFAALFAIFLAAVSPALADEIACTSDAATNIPVTEGASVTLTASPNSPEYTYDWTVGDPLTVTAGGDGHESVTFVVPACDAVGGWDVQLVMNPTGNVVEACKDTCLYTVACGGLGECPTISDACIVDSTTWTYDCTNCPESLFYEWWVSTAASPPVASDQTSWGANQVADNRAYTPSPAWDGFNVPTASDPVTHTWVTFIVRQDTPNEGTPDKVIKFCSPEDVILYFNPTTSMDSEIS